MSSASAPIPLAGSTLGRYRHVCAFFNTPEDEHHVLLPFMRTGLERGERAVYVLDPEMSVSQLARLRNAGVDVDAAHRGGQLVVRHSGDTHMPGGRFDQRAMIERIQRSLEEGRTLGFPLTRLVAHAECVLADWPHANDWLEYESRLNELLPRYEDPVICTYDCARLGAGPAMDILRTHPMVIMDRTLQENPFFVRPDQFLRELREREASPGTRRQPSSMEREGQASRLRSGVRDLVALSTIPVLWIGGSSAAIAESVRKLLIGMFRGDAAYVEVRDPGSSHAVVAAAGISEKDFRVWLEVSDQGAGATPLPLVTSTPPMHLASRRIGPNGEMGRLAVGSRRPGFPNEFESMLLQVAATQVAVALQQGALLLRREQAAQQQAAIARLGRRALSGVALDPLFHEVAEVVRDTLRVDVCELLEFGLDRETLLLRAGAGWRPGQVGRTLVGPGGARSLVGYALLKHEPIVVHELRQETRFIPSPYLVEIGVVSGMTVIVHERDGPFGLLGAHSRTRRAFTQEDLDFLQSTANLLSTALRHHGAEVEREELLARTSAAQAAAEEASRGKSEFLAMMSHELRTPMQTLSCYVELMTHPSHGPVTAAQRDDLEHIRRCQQYVLSLLDNVLAFMRLGSGHVVYDITSLALDEVLAAVAGLMRSQMEAKQLSYIQPRVGDGIRVLADRQKLEQILLNLLSNAVKFTEPGGSVRLDATLADTTVGIHVRDTGSGIPADKLASVFEPYVRVERSGSSRTEGTGLGLAISRELARAMNGQILVKSEVGKGSSFTVVMPRSGASGVSDPTTQGRG